MVAQFLQSCTQDINKHQPFKQCLEQFVNLVIRYLTRQLEADLSLDIETLERKVDSIGWVIYKEDKEDKKDKAGNVEGKQGALLSLTRIKGIRGYKEQPRCLLSYSVYYYYSELIKYYKKIYIKNRIFNQPFQCPKCYYLGIGDSQISGGESIQSNYVKTVYNKIYAPYFPFYITLAKDLFRYLIYFSSFLSR